MYVPLGFASSLRAPTSGVILVAVTVDGRAGTFLIDTGSAQSCIDARFASHLQAGSEANEQVREPYRDATANSVRIETFRVGSIHLHNLEMLSIDLANFLEAGRSIDGILGTDILRRFIVRLDFSSNSARFTTKNHFVAGARVVGLEPFNDLYRTPVEIEGTPTALLLDTGTNSTNISSAAWSRITTDWQPKLTLDGVRSTGSGDSQFVLIPRVSIGGSFSRDIPLRVQPETAEGLFAEASFDGLLGGDVLQQFIVTLDLAHNRMYLKHNPNSHIDHYLFSTIGIQFAKDAGAGFKIMAVWSPSPAATAGIKIGDLILGVNQLDAQKLSLDDLS
jgi:predicted aspartyl protease